MKRVIEFLKEWKERCRMCKEHIKADFFRYFGPRTYIISYSYSLKGETFMDSKIVRAVVPSIRDVVATVQKDLAYVQATDLRILGFSEAPSCIVKGAVIDAAEKLVAKADAEAEKLKAAGKLQVESEPQEEEEEEEDLSDMFK